ncbi:MAG TPA: ABC transporter substrate-binding protein, partial [bacterium]|nr:ABC transporter substrate-binding protein [bacterium]
MALLSHLPLGRARVAGPVLARVLFIAISVASLLTLDALAVAPASVSAAVPGADKGPGIERGSAQAVVGGTRRLNLNVQPAVLHPLNATDLYGNIVLDDIYETLTQQDVDSLRQMPLLAESWSVSADHKQFTFHINPAARWQDGQPVTAEDVKFSFDVLQDPRLRTHAKWESYYGNFMGAEVVDPLTVRFTAREDRYLNLFNLSALRIVPRHAYGTGDPNETPLAKAPLGSGPYRFESWNRGQSIVLRRDPHYWGWRLPQNVGRYNSQRLLLRFIMADKVSLESFKRGDLDEINLKPEQWFNETAAPEFGIWPHPGTRFTKLEVKNQAPRPYSYVGWNLASPLFSDRQVRLALGLLFDRDTYIQKIFHGTRVK